MQTNRKEESIIKKFLKWLIISVLLNLSIITPVYAVNESEEIIETHETINYIPPKQNMVRGVTRNWVGTHAYVVNNINGYHYGGWVPLVETLPTGHCVYMGLAPLFGADY